jgi:hypothetical protein
VSDDPIDQSIRDLIRIKAARLARSRQVPNADREDIEQTLVLDALKRLPKFDPGKSDREDHLCAVVEHAVGNLNRGALVSLSGPFHK